MTKIRIRKLSNYDRGRLVMLRGLGFHQKEIADTLSVNQEDISYHLAVIRNRCIDEGINAVWLEHTAMLMFESLMIQE